MRADLKKRLAAIPVVEPDEWDKEMLARADKDKSKPVPYKEFIKKLEAKERKAKIAVIKERQHTRQLKNAINNKKVQNNTQRDIIIKIRAARKGDNLELIKPVVAKPLKGYNILLSFSDNPSKLFVYDAAKIIHQIEALSPLKNKVLFNSFKVDGSYFYWDDTMDISPRDLYRYSIPYHEWLQKHNCRK